MGMYSSFDYEDIAVNDWKGLIKFIEEWCEIDENKSTGGEFYRKILDLKNKTVSFNSWDQIKLISYWYEETVLFLNGIARYIEGEVHWNYENNEFGGMVSFKNGKCIITTGTMEWTDWKPLEGVYRGDKRDRRMSKEFLKVYDEIKNDLMIGNI